MPLECAESRKKFNELEIIASQYPLDVITISETWLDSTIENTLAALEGYNLYRLDRSLHMQSGREKHGGASRFTLNINVS